MSDDIRSNDVLEIDEARCTDDLDAAIQVLLDADMLDDEQPYV